MKKVSLLILLFGVMSFEYAPIKQKFVISAHRGYSSIAPENTMSAFKKAIEAGADYFECDVRYTKDRKIVVLHDSTLDRTTNRSGLLSSKTYSEISKLEAGYTLKFDSDFKNERIPTLREVLQLAKENIKVEIEIKDAHMADDVVSLIEELKMEEEVSVIAFNFNEIRRVKEINATIPVKYLVGRKWGQTEIDKIISIGGEYIGPSGVPTYTQVQLAHINNIKIISYTLNSSQEIQSAIYSGIDGIATNYPLRSIKIRESNIVKQ